MLFPSGDSVAQDYINVFDIKPSRACEACLIWDAPPKRVVSIPKNLHFPKSVTWRIPDGVHRQILIWPKLDGRWASQELISDLNKAKWTMYSVSGRSHLRLMDNPQAYGIDSLPAFIVTDDEGKVLRSFKSGCGLTLDTWAMHWLATGQESSKISKGKVSVVTSGNYPLRGNWWSVEGRWNPSKTMIINHLRQHPNHAKKSFQRENLEAWSYEELQSLHSDDHEGRIRKTIAATKPKAVYCPT